MENASKIDTEIEEKIDAIPEPAIPLFFGESITLKWFFGTTGGHGNPSKM